MGQLSDDGGVMLELSQTSLRSTLVRAVALLFLAMPGPVHADTVLTFCYDPYPPYTFGTDGASEEGLKIQLLQAVVDQIDGVTAKVVLLPWKRCQEQARTGRVDGILPTFPNPDRRTYLEFTEGTFSENYSFWYLRDRFPDGLGWGGDYGALSHLTLGMITGGFVSHEMNNAFSQARPILRARDVGSLLKMLIHERVDLISTDDAVGRFHAELNGWTDMITPMQGPIVSRKSRFALSKASGADRYLDAFNRAIRTLETQGTIDAILQSTDYPESTKTTAD